MKPFIMSGGKGTRLWPVSRESFPKPYCYFFDESLMAKTIKRLSALGEVGVVTVGSQKTLLDKAYQEVSQKPGRLLFEPFGKNTAASVAWICYELIASGQGSEIVGIFPADHLVQNQKVFLEVLKLAEIRAKEGRVVTIGIQPSFPATGYGYIEIQEAANGSFGSHKSHPSVCFHEKPDVKRAEAYVESGKFLWNAGIFVFRADVMAHHFEKHMPELWRQFATLKKDHTNLKTVYESLPSISIDYGIMEKISAEIDCIPCDFGWSDVGSWKEISELVKQGPQSVVSEGAENNFVFKSSEKKTVALVGVKDLIVVDTPDALLVTDRLSSQKVGPIVKQLEEKNNLTAKEHIFDHRPWGEYRILEDDDRFKVKVIRIEAGQQISYQSHAKRAEHWIVVEGDATVVLNDKEVSVKQGEHIYIPKGSKHRMRNLTNKPVEFVEVQVGSYFGEDDIVRYQDDYGRS
ncbi:MAG: mannose-1-phosphate guanylyltransferase/mannose-6-phosphate isomerase [Bdellovibrionales bacterium]